MENSCAHRLIACGLPLKPAVDQQAYFLLYKDNKKNYLAFSIRISLISSIQVKSLYVLIHLKALTNLGLGYSSHIVKRRIICIRYI